MCVFFFFSDSEDEEDEDGDDGASPAKRSRDGSGASSGSKVLYDWLGLLPVIVAIGRFYLSQQALMASLSLGFAFPHLGLRLQVCEQAKYCKKLQETSL